MDIDSVLKGHGIGMGGSNIKSIQRISTTVGTTEKTKNITISTVDMSKSIVKVSSRAVNTNETLRTIIFTAEITTSTNVLIERDYQPSYDVMYVEIVVIEYYNVKSLQRGILGSQSLATIDIPITTVDLNKSDLIITYNINTAVINNVPFTETLTSTTNIQINTRTTNIYLTKIKYQVIEFN